MSTWVQTGQRSGRADFDRRVFRSEFADALGYGITWFRRLEKRGLIPPGRRDPGGKRLWWRASEVAATLDKLAESSQQERTTA